MVKDRVIRVGHGVSIPMNELRFQFVRSSGPGGQHVNKTATQVEVLFDVAGSPSLSQTQKRRVRRALRSYISGEGVLRLTCQSTRSQHRNREEAVARLKALLAQALTVPKRRRATRPTRGSVERRLQEKKRRSELKRQRRKCGDDAL
jgi:ribosome-associated protein